MGNISSRLLTGKQTPDAERALYWRHRIVDLQAGDVSVRQSVVRVGHGKYLRRYRPAGSGKFGDRYLEEHRAVRE
jgi:hypothetical protein